MENIEQVSSKLKLSFSNVEVLSKDWGWKMIADVEGRFQVNINNQLFFNEEGILVFEIAYVLMKWIEKIKSGKMIDFDYESIDYEDKPLLKFTQNNNTWMVYSVWELFADTSNFSLDEIINASKQYVDELLEYLKHNFKFDFLLFLQLEKQNN